MRVGCPFGRAQGQSPAPVNPVNASPAVQISLELKLDSMAPPISDEVLGVGTLGPDVPSSVLKATQAGRASGGTSRPRMLLQVKGGATGIEGWGD